MSNDVQNSQLSEDKGSKSIYIADVIRGVRKFWWVCLCLVAFFGAIMFYRFYVHFEPNYKVSATFTVDVQSSDVTMSSSNYSFYYKKSLASQLSKTFPYILQTNLLQDAIKEDLKLDSLDVKLSATAVENSNMFTLVATGNDPEMVYNVLQSAIENYPNVAHYTVGNIKLNMITEPQMPEKPTNSNTFIKQTFKGMVIGLFFGVLWILAYAVCRKTIRTKKDIKNELNQEFLGVVPRIEFKKYSEKINRSVLFNNSFLESSLTDSITVLRNSILHKLDKNDKVIMITSTAPAEGKTTVTANLAMSIGSTGKKVLLIDGDIRNQNVNNIFGLKKPEVKNDSEYTISFKEELGISILNFNVSQKKIWNIIKVSQLNELLDGLRDKYDYILIDTPPCGLISDASVIAQVTDAIVYVIFQDVVRVSRIRNGLDGMMSTGTKVLGCVLNGASSGAAGYRAGYGYNYGYGYGYRYGYGYSRYGYGYGYGYGSDKKKSKSRKKGS